MPFFRFHKSIRHAHAGLWHALLTQPNLWIHLIAGVVTVIGAAFTGFTVIEWSILVLTIMLVVILELVNTAAEAIVDLASPEYHELAKVAKDVSAAAVLVAAIGAVIVGLLLFGNYWWW